MIGVDRDDFSAKALLPMSRSLKPSVGAVAIGLSKGGKRQYDKITFSDHELKLAACSAIPATYKIHVRYGSGEDSKAGWLQQAEQHLTKLLQEETRSRITTRYCTSQFSGVSSEDVELAATPTQLPPIPMPVPMGPTLNGVTPRHPVDDAEEVGEIVPDPNKNHRLAIVPVIVTVEKRMVGKEDGALSMLHKGPGVTDDGCVLVLWRVVQLPSKVQIAEMVVNGAGADNVVNVKLTLPDASLVYGLETMLRKKEYFDEDDQNKPAMKCDNWWCWTVKYAYEKERVPIPTQFVLPPNKILPRSGEVELGLKLSSTEAAGQLTEGLHVLKIRCYTIAGEGKWSQPFNLDL